MFFKLHNYGFLIVYIIIFNFASPFWTITSKRKSQFEQLRTSSDRNIIVIIISPKYYWSEIGLSSARHQCEIFSVLHCV